MMRMKVNEELNNIITAAFAEAKARAHEYITPEHVLYASLFFDSGTDIIANCGGDIDRLKKDLETFFNGKYIPTVTGIEPMESEGFHNVIENAMLHVASSGKDMLDVGDVFASLFYEKDSFAVSFLAKDGIDRLRVLEYISHGISVIAEPEPPDSEQESELQEEERDAETQTTPPGTKPKKKKRKYLEIYTTELTAKAAAGEIDPIIGREDIIERTIQVL